MARRKFSKEEVKQWQKEHNQSVFYINENALPKGIGLFPYTLPADNVIKGSQEETAS